MFVEFSNILFILAPMFVALGLLRLTVFMLRRDRTFPFKDINLD